MEKLKEVLNNALELTPYERGVLIEELMKSEELKRTTDKFPIRFARSDLWRTIEFGQRFGVL